MLPRFDGMSDGTLDNQRVVVRSAMIGLLMLASSREIFGTTEP